MRRPGTVLLVALLAAAVLASCGDDEAGDDARTPAGGSLSTEEAQPIVDRSLLALDDLGPGWELISTEEPGPDGAAEEDDELEECMGRDFDLEEETIAESETRTFQRSVSPTEQLQLVVSSGALEDVAVVEELFDAVASEQFARCLTESFQEQLAAEGEGESSLGEIEIDEDYIDGPDRSVRLRAPLTATVGPITLETRFDVVAVATGQVTTLFAVVSLGEHVADDQLAGWAELVAQRQAG